MDKIISALDTNEMSCETFGTKIEPFLAAVDWQLIVGVKMEICERHLSTFQS